MRGTEGDPSHRFSRCSGWNGIIGIRPAFMSAPERRVDDNARFSSIINIASVALRRYGAGIRDVIPEVYVLGMAVMNSHRSFPSSHSFYHKTVIINSKGSIWLSPHLLQTFSVSVVGSRFLSHTGVSLRLKLSLHALTLRLSDIA
jgi:hypothetical protein